MRVRSVRVVAGSTPQKNGSARRIGERARKILLALAGVTDKPNNRTVMVYQERRLTFSIIPVKRVRRFRGTLGAIQEMI